MTLPDAVTVFETAREAQSELAEKLMERANDTALAFDGWLEEQSDAIPEAGSDEGEDEGEESNNDNLMLPLVEYLLAHVENPAPSLQEKRDISRVTGLPLKCISTWFNNTRKRRWKPVYKENRPPKFSMLEYCLAVARPCSRTAPGASQRAKRKKPSPSQIHAHVSVRAKRAKGSRVCSEAAAEEQVQRQSCPSTAASSGADGLQISGGQSRAPVTLSGAEESRIDMLKHKPAERAELTSESSDHGSAEAESESVTSEAAAFPGYGAEVENDVSNLLAQVGPLFLDEIGEEMIDVFPY